MAFLTALALGSMIAGTTVGAIGRHKAGKEQQRVADFNATQAGLQATDATRRGAEDVNVFRREVRGIAGAQRAGYAAQGVDVSGGTPAALRTSTEGLLQSDLARLTRNAEREAMGYKAEAQNYTLQGQYARRAAKWDVASTILGGAADASLMASRMDWNQKKPPAPGGGTTASRTSPDYIHLRSRQGR